MNRPIFLLRLRAQKDADPIKALRRLLKYALRTCGLRCISIDHEIPPNGNAS
jgi:hypothetical protein